MAFSFAQLHELVHSLSEWEHERFLHYLRTERRSQQLLQLYTTLREHEFKERYHYESKLPPEVFRALTVLQRRLRDEIHSFLIRASRHHSVHHRILVVRLLSERGLFEQALQLVDETFQRPPAPLSEDLHLVLLRYRLFLLRMLQVTTLPEEEFGRIEQEIQRYTSSLRLRLRNEILQLHARQLYHRPNNHEVLPPQRVNEFIGSFREILERYRALAPDSPFLSEAQLDVEITQAALAELLERQKPLPHATQQLIVEVAQRLIHHDEVPMDFEFVFRRVVSYQEILMLLLLSTCFAEAEHLFDRMHRYVKAAMGRLPSTTHAWMNTELLLAEAHLRGIMLDLPTQSDLLHKMWRRIQQHSFATHSPLAHRIISLYAVCNHYAAGEYRRALRIARTYLQRHFRILPNSWMTQMMVAIWLVILFETGRRKELRKLMRYELSQWPLPEVSTPLHHLMKLIEANNYHWTPDRPLKGADQFRQAILNEIKSSYYSFLANAPTPYYLFFDYLSWIDAMEGHGTYRELIRRKNEILRSHRPLKPADS